MKSSSILGLYQRYSLPIERGEGCYLYLKDGSHVLDFMSGIAANSLGHCHPALVEALNRQSKLLWHTSNLLEIPGMADYANLLTSHSFADKVFFCNSGTEAVEASLKIMRRYQQAVGKPKRTRVISFTNAFHGRTFVAASAGGLAKCWDNLGSPIDMFDRVEWGNSTAVEQAITQETAGILLEPIQGDGGIVLPPEGFLTDLRKIADRYGLILLFDEVQTGMGRTGKLFAHEHWGITPDIMASAKGLGGGFAIGACLVTERVAQTITPGMHGSTYGGNPLAMAVGKTVLEHIIANGFLEHVNQMSRLFLEGLEVLQYQHPHIIREVRGKGLLIGLQLAGDSNAFFRHLAKHGLLSAPAANHVLRFLPPLIIEEDHVKKAIAILDNACAGYIPSSKQKDSNDAVLRKRALARWENEGGSTASERGISPSKHSPAFATKKAIAC